MVRRTALPWFALVALLLTVAGGWAQPADGVLWQETFTAGWTSAWPHQVEVRPGPDGVTLRAAASPSGLGRLTRTVPLDLGQRGYPYLLLDLAAASPSVFGGVGLSVERDGRQRELLPVVRESGRYLLDLREFLPELAGRQGEARLQLVLRGAAVELPGPETRVRELVCLARPPVTITVVEPGRVLQIELPAPADRVTVGLAPDSVELRPLDPGRRRWQAALPGDLPAGARLARVEVDGELAVTASLRLGPGASAGPVAPPVIDGILNDPAWDGARVAPLAQGQARVWVGPEALYLAAVLPPRVARLPVTVQAGARGPSYRFEAHPDQPLASRPGDPGWEAVWQSAMVADERGWIVELRWPWALFEPGAGPWRVELAGQVVDLPPPPTSLTAGPLEVGGLRRGGALQAWLSLPVTNRTEATLPLRGEARLTRLGEPAAAAVAESTLAAGETAALRWRLPVPAPGSYRLDWSLTAGAEVLRSERRTVTVDSRPLQVRLLQPSYRDAIYFTENLDEAIAEVLAPGYLPAGVDLVASLLLGDVVIDQQIFPRPGERFVVRFPVAGLPEEDYRLRVTARLGDEVLGADEVPLRKLPLGPASEVRLDPAGRLLLNVAPVRPVVGPGGIEILDRPPSEASGPWFLQPLAPLFREAVGAPALNEAGRARLTAVIDAVRAHPRLLGYWLGDEDDLARVEPRYRTDVYRHVRASDPHHPVLGADPAASDLLVLARPWADSAQPWLARAAGDAVWDALASSAVGVWVDDAPTVAAAQAVLAGAGGAPIERNGPAQLTVLGGRTASGWSLLIGNPTAAEVRGRFELGVTHGEPVPVIGEARTVPVRFGLTDIWPPGAWRLYSTEPALRPADESRELRLPAEGAAAAITDGGPAGWPLPASPPRLVWSWAASRPVVGFEVTWRGGGRYRVEGLRGDEWELLDEVDSPGEGPRATRFLALPLDVLRLSAEPPAEGVAELVEWRVWFAGE